MVLVGLQGLGRKRLLQQICHYRQYSGIAISQPCGDLILALREFREHLLKPRIINLLNEAPKLIEKLRGRLRGQPIISFAGLQVQGSSQSPQMGQFELEIEIGDLDPIVSQL